MTARLPLTVIGGFLGAGKTTLLNDWLSQPHGQRLAVLVNDFGALNIDAALIAQSGADAIALSNGCICCSIGDDLSAALIRVIESPTPFDGIVIEASGVSDPWKIAQVARADAALELNSVVVLVDADAVLHQAADALLADSLARQVRAADLVVLNKVDLVADARELERVHEWLDRIVPDTPRIETRHARLPAALRNGPSMPAHAHDPACARDPVHATDHDHDHGAEFETWIASPKQTLSSSALRAALKAMPRGVLRMKGFVRSDHASGWAELQFAGRHGSLRAIETVPTEAPVLVAIGLSGELPKAALAEWLADVACTA